MDKCPAGTQGGACRERELHPEIGAVRLGRHHEGAGGSGTLPLLSGCIICPELDSDTKPVQTGYDGRIWTWIEQAGLRLTASELIRLEEQGTKPVPALLGEQGRQELTEQIYSSKELIWDGTLESEMERSPARDALVMSLLRLLRMGRLFWCRGGNGCETGCL